MMLYNLLFINLFCVVSYNSWSFLIPGSSALSFAFSRSHAEGVQACMRFRYNFHYKALTSSFFWKAILILSPNLNCTVYFTGLILLICFKPVFTRSSYPNMRKLHQFFSPRCTKSAKQTNYHLFRFENFTLISGFIIKTGLLIICWQSLIIISGFVIDGAGVLFFVTNNNLFPDCITNIILGRNCTPASCFLAIMVLQF